MLEEVRVQSAFYIFAITLLVTVFAFQAFAAENPKCRIDVITDSDDVPVEFLPAIIKGTLIPSSSENAGRVSYKDMDFSALWNSGDQYEPQNYFQMSFDDTTSTVYDIVPEKQIGPINVIVRNDIRFQCWFEK